jgi:hypothetical protein
MGRPHDEAAAAALRIFSKKAVDGGGRAGRMRGFVFSELQLRRHQPI